MPLWRHQRVARRQHGGRRARIRLPDRCQRRRQEHIAARDIRAQPAGRRPVAGTISFEGERIDRALPATIVRLGIAQCPEERKLWPQISVEEHLEIGAFTRRDKGEIAADIERIYGIFPRLKERQRQDAGTLSGGEQQMVAIGRALMSRPRLLMMDEPSLGLAPMIVESMAEVIKDIHTKGTSILLVEQNAMVALRMADRAGRSGLCPGGGQHRP
jgi:branched-chain amino acid transport system ATP-binding protein